MKNFAFFIFAALLVAAAFPPPATAGDSVKDAVMDYRLGHYQAAFIKMNRLAEEQNPEAMFWVGSMWHKGLGTPRDHAKAFAYYSDSALMGDVKAQNNLGLLYRDGLGVKRNYSVALAWFMVAAADHDAIAQANKDRLQYSMTAEQIRRSREMARETKVKILTGEAARRDARSSDASRQTEKNSPGMQKQKVHLLSALGAAQR